MASCVLVFLALSTLALAETTFHGRVVKPEGAPVSFLRETKVILDGGAFQAFLQEDGEFSFDNIPSGAYHLEVVSPNFEFEPLRVEIRRKSEEVVRVFKADLMGGRAVQRVAYTAKSGLTLNAYAAARIFEEPQSMSVLDLLKNPMVMMMGMLLLSTTILPKLTPQMTPEELAEMQRQSASVASAAPSLDLSSTLARLSAGGSGDQPAAGKPKRN